MSLQFWRHDRAPRIEVDDTWYGFRYAGVRTTPNGNTHVRVTAYALPYSSMVTGIPFSTGQLMFVPIDDENCWGYFSAPKARQNPRGLGGRSVFSYAPFTTPVSADPNGITPRRYTADNDYQVDRDVRNNGIFSGIHDFGSQDMMAVESQGSIRDRSVERLGPRGQQEAPRAAQRRAGPSGWQEAARPGQRPGLRVHPRCGEGPRTWRGLAAAGHQRRPPRPGSPRTGLTGFRT
jgi:hypothetical protein